MREASNSFGLVPVIRGRCVCGAKSPLSFQKLTSFKFGVNWTKKAQTERVGRLGRRRMGFGCEAFFARSESGSSMPFPWWLFRGCKSRTRWCVLIRTEFAPRAFRGAVVGSSKATTISSADLFVIVKESKSPHAYFVLCDLSVDRFESQSMPSGWSSPM